MIFAELARGLRDAGLNWRPATGDAFIIDGPEFDGDVFTVSDMTIESHEFDTGTILGFNGTTEWALDSVALEDSLWLPREEQLRGLLKGSFRTLTREDEGGEADSDAETDSGASSVFYRVDVAFPGTGHRSFTDPEPANAYARALLALMVRSRVDAD